MWIILFVMLWATPVWATDYCVTHDCDQTPTTGKELLVGGDEDVLGSLTVGGACTVTGETQAPNFRVGSGGGGLSIPSSAAPCFYVVDGIGRSTSGVGGLVECNGGTEDLIVTDSRRDTCTEIYTVLGLNPGNRTGTCGKVVFSQAPSFTGLVQSEAGHDGPTASPTPSATPTGATPTATAATPTPTATASPVRAIDGNLDVNGKAHVTGISTFDDANTTRKDSSNSRFVNVIENQNGGNLATAGIQVRTGGTDGFLFAYPASSIAGAPFSDSIALYCDTTATGGCIIDAAANAPIYFFTNALQRWKITANGHLISTGADPALSVCGTTPVFVGGDDMEGRFTTGTGVVTACTLTFAGTYAIAPKCNILNETTIAAVPVVASTSGFTITAMLSQTFSYDCHGFE